MVDVRKVQTEDYKTTREESATVPTGIVALIHSTKFFIRTDNSTKHDTQRHKKNISKIAKNLKICFFYAFFCFAHFYRVHSRGGRSP